MKLRVLLLVGTVLALSPPLLARKRADALCAPLIAFAKSVAPDEERTLTFHTSWGGNFKDDPEPVIFAKRCIHHGYGPAMKVCSYLMEHGAVEFSDNNLKRAVMCLSPATRFDSRLSLGSASISLPYGTSERGSRINIDFAEDPKIGGMVLKIAADGY